MATLANTSQANLQSFGQNGYGFNVVTDGNAHSGDFSAITILTDTVFDSITGNNIQLHGTSSTDALDGITIPAGITIFGKISAFELASGSVIAYFTV